MKTKLMILVALALVSGCVLNQRTDGPPNPYAKVDFSVVNSPRTVRRLDSVIVPEVNFLDADIDTVIRWIVAFSEQCEAAHGKKGVRYLVPFGNYPIHGPLPKITFTAASISLLEVIKITADIADLDYVIYDQDLLEFRNKGGQPGPAAYRR